MVSRIPLGRLCETKGTTLRNLISWNELENPNKNPVTGSPLCRAIIDDSFVFTFGFGLKWNCCVRRQGSVNIFLTCLGAFHCSYIHMKYWRCVLWILNEHCFCNGNNDKVIQSFPNQSMITILGCFRFGDPSTPVPCFREQTRPGFLALWIRLIIISFVPQINEKADRSTNQALKSSRIQQSRIKGAKNSFL